MRTTPWATGDRRPKTKGSTQGSASGIGTLTPTCFPGRRSGGGTPPRSSCVGAPRAYTIGSATTTSSACPRRATSCAPAFAWHRPAFARAPRSAPPRRPWRCVAGARFHRGAGRAPVLLTPAHRQLTPAVRGRKPCWKDPGGKVPIFVGARGGACYDGTQACRHRWSGTDAERVLTRTALRRRVHQGGDRLHPPSPARLTPYHPSQARVGVTSALVFERPLSPCQVHGILERAGRLHDTSLVIVGDHGEGFELAHEQDRVHGGTVYDTQVLYHAISSQ